MTVLVGLARGGVLEAMITWKQIRSASSLAAKALAVFLAVFSTATYVITLALGPILFFTTSEGISAAGKAVEGIPIDLFMAFTIPLPLTVSIGTVFVSVWFIFVIALLFAWLSRNGFPNAVRDVLTKAFSPAKTNFLFIMPMVATALLYSTILIQQFQEAQGVQTGSLNFPPATSPYVILINLAFAPVREEIAFRITSIGIPLGVFLVLAFRSDERMRTTLSKLKFVLIAMLSPEQAKSRLGYRCVNTHGFVRGITPLEWILILITAAVFGLAHFLLGGGWQMGKITTTFLAGLVLGIMYVAYGTPAAILLHWYFNYYFTILDLAVSTFGGVFQILATFTELTTMVAGIVIMVGFLLFFAVRLADYLTLRAAGLAGKRD